ncbi:MAG: DUF2007 domain-containing protein [Flavobacteriales bacterium]|nr:DUF2007 domain-containing protein [Flavobacteriales bacterium]
MVTLLICENDVEAHLMKGTLESEGIHAYIANEYLNTIIPGYTNIGGIGMKLMVDDADIEKAKVILTAYFPRLTPGVKLVCPNCGSEELTVGHNNDSVQKIAFGVLSLITATPMNNIRGELQCTQCGKIF